MIIDKMFLAEKIIELEEGLVEKGDVSIHVEIEECNHYYSDSGLIVRLPTYTVAYRIGRSNTVFSDHTYTVEFTKEDKIKSTPQKEAHNILQEIKTTI